MDGGGKIDQIQSRPRRWSFQLRRNGAARCRTSLCWTPLSASLSSSAPKERRDVPSRRVEERRDVPSRSVEEWRDVPSRRVGCGTHPTSCSLLPHSAPRRPNSRTPDSESNLRSMDESAKCPVKRASREVCPPPVSYFFSRVERVDHVELLRNSDG